MIDQPMVSSVAEIVVLLEQVADDNQPDARRDVGERDHHPPADGVEQPAEHHRAEEVARRERQQVPAHGALETL